MALKGYFIQATFEDGTEVSAYAAYDGTWYYFYTDRRFRFTLTNTGAVDIQQYQPIGSNMAWYDINIITAVSVEQFDPDNSGGGGAIPDDVYTKEEVQQLIAAAVEEVESQIPDLVAQAVQEALEGLDDRYVRKTGDTMTGTLRVQNATGQYSVLAATECTVFGTDNNVFMNPKTGFGVTTSSGQYKGRLDQDGYYQCNPAGDSSARVVVNYNGATWYQANKVVTNIYYSNNHGTINLRDTQSDDTYFLVGSTQLNMYVNNGLRAQIRASENDGNFIAYDSSGNNTWYMPAQISAWTSGGTSQSLITPGADTISFNKTVQVPSSASFLVSGACRYAGTYMNRYGDYWDMQFNDYSSFGWTTGQLNVNSINFTLYYPNSGGYRTIFNAGSIQVNAGSSGTFPSITINARNGSVNTTNSSLNLGPASSNIYSTSISGLGINFTDASNNTTLAYIMNNLGGSGGGGGGTSDYGPQISRLDSNINTLANILSTQIVNRQAINAMLNALAEDYIWTANNGVVKVWQSSAAPTQIQCYAMKDFTISLTSPTFVTSNVNTGSIIQWSGSSVDYTHNLSLLGGSS